MSDVPNSNNRILVWLPSPLGDAVLSTPALRSIRGAFADSEIYYYAPDSIRQLIEPFEFNDKWVQPYMTKTFAAARLFRSHKFNHAILLKNSFGSAVTVFLAGIESRVGYVREKRGIFINEKLYPAKNADGTYKPNSMIDYYLAIASWLGGETQNRKMHLNTTQEDTNSLYGKIPALAMPARENSVAVIVPGGAFGTSKRWPVERFAAVADYLVEQHQMQVVICAANNPDEKKVAGKIQDAARSTLISLADTPVSLGQLKALFKDAELVITNDTGPRHIAIAFDRKVVTLFGPNDPAWTESEHPKEIKIVGKAHCAPCARPSCKQDEHECMNSITVEMVIEAVEKLLNAEHCHE